MLARRLRGFHLPLLLLVALASPSWPDQRNPPSNRPKAPGIQRERVSLVLIDVVVTDKKGRSLDDLRPGEFTLKVDGDVQPIESVEFRFSGETVPPPPATPSSVSPPKAEGKSAVAALRPPIAYTRHFVLFLDGLNSERGLRAEVIGAARRFLQTGFGHGDQVMVATQGRGLKIVQGFTDDPEKIRAALDSIQADRALQMAGENRTRFNVAKLQEEGIRCPGCIKSMAQDFEMEDRGRIMRTLASLKALVAYLHPLDGRKDLIFLTDGFPSEPGSVYGLPDHTGIRAEVLTLSREAASALVALHAINTLGIPGSAPVQGALSGISPIGPEAKRDEVAGPSSGPPIDELMEREGTTTLTGLALNTGGVSIHGSNKFEAGLAQIEKATRASYVLAYVPSGPPDGKFHATRITVSRKGVTVRTRQGFIFLTEEQVGEREILSAYVAPELFHDIPVALDIRSYLTADEKPAVEIALAVPDESLLLQPMEGRFVARLEAGVTLQSGKDLIVDRFSRSTEARLPPVELASEAEVTLLAHRTIPPGEYDAVAVVRDLGTGNIGAIRSHIKVPQLPSDRIAMSSLVLGSKEEAAGTWVNLDEAPNPDGQLIVPTVRRIFLRSAEPVGSCLVYHPQRDVTTGEARVKVVGSIWKGGASVREFPGTLRVLTADQKNNAIPVEFPLALADLAPGLYTLRVEAFDEVGGRGIMQTLDFLVR